MVLRYHRCWGAHATCKMVRGARSAQRGFRSGRPAVRESTKRCSGRLPCRKPSDASTRRFRAAPRRATHMRRPERCVTPAPRVIAPAACWTAAHDSTNLSCGRGGARLRVQRAVHRFCDAGDAAGHMRRAGACGERRVRLTARRTAWLVRTSRLSLTRRYARGSSISTLLTAPRPLFDAEFDGEPYDTFMRHYIHIIQLVSVTAVLCFALSPTST